MPDLAFYAQDAEFLAWTLYESKTAEREKMGSQSRKRGRGKQEGKRDKKKEGKREKKEKTEGKRKDNEAMTAGDEFNKNDHPDDNLNPEQDGTSDVAKSLVDELCSNPATMYDDEELFSSSDIGSSETECNENDDEFLANTHHLVPDDPLERERAQGRCVDRCLRMLFMEEMGEKPNNHTLYGGNEPSPNNNIVYGHGGKSRKNPNNNVNNVLNVQQSSQNENPQIQNPQNPKLQLGHVCVARYSGETLFLAKMPTPGQRRVLLMGRNHCWIHYDTGFRPRGMLEDEMIHLVQMGLMSASVGAGGTGENLPSGTGIGENPTTSSSDDEKMNEKMENMNNSARADNGNGSRSSSDHGEISGGINNGGINIIKNGEDSNSNGEAGSGPESSGESTSTTIPHDRQNLISNSYCGGGDNVADVSQSGSGTASATVSQASATVSHASNVESIPISNSTSKASSEAIPLSKGSDNGIESKGSGIESKGSVPLTLSKGSISIPQRIDEENSSKCQSHNDNTLNPNPSVLRRELDVLKENTRLNGGHDFLASMPLKLRSVKYQEKQKRNVLVPGRKSSGSQEGATPRAGAGSSNSKHQTSYKDTPRNTKGTPRQRNTENHSTYDSDSRYSRTNPLKSLEVYNHQIHDFSLVTALYQGKVHRTFLLRGFGKLMISILLLLSHLMLVPIFEERSGVSWNSVGDSGVVVGDSGVVGDGGNGSGGNNNLLGDGHSSQGRFRFCYDIYTNAGRYIHYDVLPRRPIVAATQAVGVASPKAKAKAKAKAKPIFIGAIIRNLGSEANPNDVNVLHELHGKSTNAISSTSETNPNGPSRRKASDLHESIYEATSTNADSDTSLLMILLFLFVDIFELIWISRRHASSATWWFVKHYRDHCIRNLAVDDYDDTEGDIGETTKGSATTNSNRSGSGSEYRKCETPHYSVAPKAAQKYLQRVAAFILFAMALINCERGLAIFSVDCM